MENSNYNNDGRNENSNASGAANYETGNSQPESSSTYSYSYLNQEQKNPNNIWRAEENTASAYSSSAQGAAGNAQPGAGKHSLKTSVEGEIRVPPGSGSHSCQLGGRTDER